MKDTLEILRKESEPDPNLVWQQNDIKLKELEIQKLDKEIKLATLKASSKKTEDRRPRLNEVLPDAVLPCTVLSESPVETHDIP